MSIIASAMKTVGPEPPGPRGSVTIATAPADPAGRSVAPTFTALGSMDGELAPSEGDADASGDVLAPTDGLATTDVALGPVEAETDADGSLAAGVDAALVVGFGVGLGVGLGVGFGVGLGVGLGVGVGVGFGVGLGVGFGVGFGVGLGVGDGVGVGLPGGADGLAARVDAGRATSMDMMATTPIMARDRASSRLECRDALA